MRAGPRSQGLQELAGTIVDRGLILDSQVARGLAVIGDRWAYVIIRDICLGVRRFEDFRRRNDIVRGTLSARLKSLVDSGILHRHAYQETPQRFEYRLTPKGLDLYPVILMAWEWETKWGRGAFLPPALVHRSCGKSMRPRLRCAECHRDIAPHDVRYAAGNSARPAHKVPPRFQRRSKSRPARGDADESSSFTILDVVGDRWTALVIAAAFFGVRRYDDIAESIGIATNILADRLKLLVDVGVLERLPYQERPLRHEYRLSAMGKDLYAHTVAIHEWADRWLLGPGESPLKLEHLPCGSPLVSEVVCSECGEVLQPQDVSYREPGRGAARPAKRAR